MSSVHKRKLLPQPRASAKQATRPETFEVAGLRRRVIAYLLDGICQFIIYRAALILADALWLRISPYAVSTIVLVCYSGFFWELYNGQTPGKCAMGIRVVRVDGHPITGQTVVVRCAGYYLNSFALGLGWLAILIDGEHRGWHDRLAGTIVVVSRPHAATGKKSRILGKRKKQRVSKWGV